LPFRWANIRLLVFHFVLDSIVFVGLSLSFLKIAELFHYYNLIIARSFDIPDADKVSFCYLVAVVSAIETIVLTFRDVVQYRATVMNLNYEHRSNLDEEINSVEVRAKFVEFFNFMSFFMGLNMKLLVIGMVILTFNVGKMSIRLWSNNEVPTVFCLISFSFFVLMNIEVSCLCYMFYSMMSGLFLNFKVFKHEVKLCKQGYEQLDKNSVIENHWKVSYLWSRMMRIQRRILFYNRNISDYYWITDMNAKASTLYSIINAIKTNDITSCIFCVLFGLFFLTYCFMSDRVAFYTAIMPKFANNLHSYINRENRSSKMSLNYNRRIWNSLRVEKGVHFFSTRNDLLGMGITCGKQFIYTKYKVVESVFMFFYLLILLFIKNRKK